MRFEFVDVQDLPASERPETPLASHQNQVAQDLQTKPLPEDHLPNVAGISQNKESFDSPAPSMIGDNGSPHEQNEVKATKEQAENPQEEDGFDFSDILKQDPKKAQKAQERAVFGRAGAPRKSVPLENSPTSALEHGGLQLSTYAWDFAPYMAYLKRQIDRHIFPPRIFDLGLVDGTTRLKFRIYRDGRLEGPELLDFKGSTMLKDTSLKAIELSAPFRNLPKDFPDDFLEIVGTFQFIVLRDHQQQ
ncbi:MAG: hypothetical protein HOE48_24815 [Candidatus Latescibacteria bacterium]|nr:hypothetical protein [Candidatus Latescibacterota bacterium]